MYLYDQVSNVDWFYDQIRTADEMMAMPKYSALFREPCVVYDNGAGRAYRFETLADLAGRWCVPDVGDPESVLSKVQSVMDGTYRDPGVAELESATIQLATLATMQVATMDLTSYNASQVASFRDYWPEWQEGVSYKQNDCVRYDGKYWRVSQDTTSRGIYPPGTSESLYYEVELAPDGIIVYRTCHGEYDMVRAGETRHYPDAEGPVYEALEDTAYSPDVYPAHWKKVEGEEEA